MQNRNMYLYRRQGPKKRVKTGSSKKSRNQPKGLPNSARDLLPLIQPATKALAQMLAGRTAASGQLRHARSILSHVDRLVSDRAHNRLNPAEREEFFEQIARLKLTLADADSEAEVQAAEDDAPPPAPLPVNRERLKEMAMALTSPGSSEAYGKRDEAEPAEQEEDSAGEDVENAASSVEPTARPAVDDRPDDPNQLRLPRANADRIGPQPDTVRARSNGRRRVTKPASPPAPKKPSAELGDRKAAGNHADEPKGAESKPKKQQKLPKGWIIDDEGFVVPGPA